MKPHKRVIAILFIGFFGLFINPQVILCQKAEPMNLNEIASKLNFTSQISKSKDEINQQLIDEIGERKINFILNETDENTLKKDGANDLLIKAIYLNSTNKIEEQKILYEEFTNNYSGNLQQRKIAVKAAKEYVRRYSDEKDSKEMINYLVQYISLAEEHNKRLEESAKTEAKRAERSARYSRALNGRQWSELFKIGAEYFKENPEDVDATINLAEIGFDVAVNKSNRDHLTETVFYAEKSIELLNKRAEIKSRQIYFSPFKDRRGDYLGYMNYIIGYIKYFYLDQKNEAIEYFRKALQHESRAKNLIRKLNILPETPQ